MWTVELDDQTGKQLAALAAAKQLSLRDYMRDVILPSAQSAEALAVGDMADSIRRSNDDIMAGRMLKSTGDYYQDKQRFEAKEQSGWQ